MNDELHSLPALLSDQKGLGGPQSRFRPLQKSKIRCLFLEPNCDALVVQPFAWPLYRLRYQGSYWSEYRSISEQFIVYKILPADGAIPNNSNADRRECNNA